MTGNVRFLVFRRDDNGCLIIIIIIICKQFNAKTVIPEAWTHSISSENLDIY